MRKPKRLNIVHFAAADGNLDVLDIVAASIGGAEMNWETDSSDGPFHATINAPIDVLRPIEALGPDVSQAIHLAIWNEAIAGVKIVHYVFTTLFFGQNPVS
jgi:hypothetical protein